MLTLAQSALLGAVQGLTEFLPVSSSGHLILMRDVLGVNISGGLAFDAVLQLATILAVYVYFRKDIARLITSAFRLCTRQRAIVTTQEKHLLFAICIGTVPALLLGVLLEKTMDTTFRNSTIVAVSLLLGSALMAWAEFRASRHAHRTTNVDSPSSVSGFWIGCFQALALVPGISRSGATISGGLLLGLTRESAARFSFLLSLPVITLSGLKKLFDLIRDSSASFEWFSMLFSSAIAFGIGLACIHLLLTYLKQHSLMVFVWYRLLLGSAVLCATIVFPLLSIGSR